MKLHFVLSGVTVLLLINAAVSQPPEPARKPSKSTITGVLKGALSTHDGTTDWVALIVGETATHLVTSTSKDYGSMKKLTGKRVLAEGTLHTDFHLPTGEVKKASGTVAGISYTGCIELASASDVTAQKTEELTGTVDLLETDSPTDPKKKLQELRFVVDDAPKRTLTIAPAAQKKLKDHVSKKVTLKAYVSNSRIEDIEKATPTQPPPK